MLRIIEKLKARRRIKRILNELFKLKDADQVADYLYSVNAKGYRRNSYTCPIANYLRKELNTCEIQVKELRVHIHNKPYVFPESINSFIRLFDCGFYPILDASDAHVLDVGKYVRTCIY